MDMDYLDHAADELLPELLDEPEDPELLLVSFEALLLELLSPEELLPEEELSLDGLLGDPPSPATFFFLPVLKSVSYQPLPFSLKAAAETNFFSAGLPHSGQSFSRSSLIFCNFSSL